MPENLYEDDTETAEAPSTEPTKPEDREGKTALIDSAICPGMQPGDEMVVKIEKVLDKEYLVSYAPEPEEDEEEEGEYEREAPTPESTTSGAMAAMME